jgi:bile acid:Na+ symporter, BASS family
VSVVVVGMLLVASMTAVGTALTVTQLRALARRPIVLVAAVVLNAVVVPALAVALCGAAGLPDAATLGIVLAAASPGGGTGALLTLHARGDLALGAGLQGVLAPVGLVTAPGWAAVAGYDVVPPGWGGVLLVGGGLAGQAVRLTVGMWLRHRRPDTALRVHRLARRVADVLLAALVVYFVVTAGSRLPDLGWAPVVVAVLLVAVCLASVAVPAWGHHAARRAVAMTTTARNLSLALFVAAPVGAPVVVALLAYGLVMYVLSVPAALWTGRAGQGGQALLSPGGGVPPDLDR